MVSGPLSNKQIDDFVESWSPEQALLNLFCFSTVEPGGGGTLLVEGSHHRAAHIVWESEPEGLDADDFDGPLHAALEEEGWPGVVEVVAEEGDIVLAHPLLFHSHPNHGPAQSRPRSPGHGTTRIQHDGAEAHQRRRPVAGRDPAGPGPAVSTLKASEERSARPGGASASGDRAPRRWSRGPR